MEEPPILPRFLVQLAFLRFHPYFPLNLFIVLKY